LAHLISIFDIEDANDAIRSARKQKVVVMREPDPLDSL
jgi:hypothetical protein